MATPGPPNPQAVTAQVKKLINTQLKQVLRGSGLPISGAKAALQTRIIDRLESYLRANDLDGFNRLRSLCYNPDANANTLSPSPSTARSYPNSSTQPPSQYPSPFGGSTLRPIMPPTANGPGPKAPMFKGSPFFSILEPLTPVLECKALVRETTRDTVQKTINLRADIADRLNQSSTIRAMIYCAADSLSSPFSRVDIAFPHQIEIKVNQDEVKSNLRGLKNKAGSTRPADITNLLRKRAGYENHMVVTYALTTKVRDVISPPIAFALPKAQACAMELCSKAMQRFFLLVNLVNQHPVEDLVQKLKYGKRISKERVISEMISKAEDSDIVATSCIMSLKCPLSTLRIGIPCRSTVCSHNQCFDATSFLQLQEQAPTWTCPVCSKLVNFGDLEVDLYVDDILKSTPKSVDQVTIEPNGKWSTTTGVGNTPRPSNGQRSSSDDEDLIEIQEPPQVTSVKREVSRDAGMISTPPISSREPSTSSGLATHSSNKRPASQVVDLTFSSDEDDEPIRAPKRQNTQKMPNGLSSLPITENTPFGPNVVLPGIPKQNSYPSNPFPASNYQPRGYGPLS